MAIAEYVRAPKVDVPSAALAKKLHELWETNPGLYGWISTVDHKEIGIRYIVTAFAFLIVGGIEALIMRVQLLIAWFFGIEPPLYGYLAVLPALLLAGLMLGAFGLLLSSMVRQLENFAGIMNFVIFPTFFASSALYPLWRVRESSELLWHLCMANPFTHAVELIRFALYGELHLPALAIVCGCTVLFMAIAILGFDPARGFMQARRGG